MNSASFLAVSTLTRNTQSLGSLSLTPGQVSSSLLRPPPMTLTSFFFFRTIKMKRLGSNSSVFGSASEQSRHISFGSYWHGMMFADRDGAKDFSFCLLSCQEKDTSAWVAYIALWDKDCIPLQLSVQCSHLLMISQLICVIKLRFIQ